MKRRRLKINTVAGIVDIINSILFLISLFVVGITALGEAVLGGDGSVTSGVGTFFYLAAGFGLILHLVGLVKSRKVGISITGHVLGIIGCGIFLLTIFLAIPAMILTILAAIFTLWQKRAV